MTDLIERAKEALEEHEASWDENGKYLVGKETTALEDMAPDLARALIAAGEVAETHRAMLRMMDDALKGTGKGDMAITPDESLTLVDAWKRDAAFRAIVEGRA